MLPSTIMEGEIPTGPPPSGPPTGASTTQIGDEVDFIQRVTWTNADLTAQTQIGFIAASCATGVPDTIRATVGAQISQWESNEGETCTWYVRHAKNGQFSAWVLAPCGNCTE